MENSSLAKLDVVYKAIQTATTFQEVKDTLDMLAAAKVYAQQHKVGEEIQLNVAEYILRAERKLGQMVNAAKKAGQLGRGYQFHKNSNVPDENITKVTLSDANIPRKLSSQAQKLASISEKDFEKRITEQKATGKANSLTRGKIMQSNGQKIKPVPFRPHPETERIISLYDAGKPLKEIARTVELNSRSIDNIIAKEKARRSGMQATTHEIPSEILSLSGREKLERAIRQEKDKLGHSFRIAVAQQVDIELNYRLNGITERWQKEQDQSRRIMRDRRGFMTKQIFKLILSCLHPDWVTDSKQKYRYENAFTAFLKLEKFVLDEKESPTEFMQIPKTREEWDAMRKKPYKIKPNATQTVVAA
jgi:hypothetical protein